MNAKGYRVWAAALLLAVAACGGGGVGSGGTGDAVQTVGVGTVTGFGSVIVDGTTFDDSDARIEIERVPGEAELAELKLGQRVDVAVRSAGVAGTVRVEPQVVGRVTAMDATTLTVLGQAVVVNAEPAAGPVTVFQAPLVSLAGVAVGDTVEVHAVLRRDGAGAAMLQATRIEKKSALPAYLRVAGVVGELTGSRFRLGALTVDAGAARLLPDGARLARGATVIVWARPGDYTSATQTLRAAAVRVKAHANGAIEAFVGGVVSDHAAAAGTFVIDGVPVRLAAGVRVTPAGAVIADGVYVQVRGRFADDGTLVATAAKVRRRGGGEEEAELKGTALDVVAVPLSFSVRGVRVDAAGVVPRGCGSALVEGRFVEVKGVVTPTGVRAASVECQGNGDDQDSHGRTIERRGVASAVDLAARSFTLTRAGGARLAVQWDDRLTLFRRVTPATLAGARVKVEGRVEAGVLIARKVKLDNGGDDED